MIPSRVLRAGQPGFWRRSLDEFKRQAIIAVKMEGLHVPRKAFPIIHFDSPDSPQACKVMSDATTFGGYSKAELSYQPGAPHREVEPGQIGGGEGVGEEPSHALFKGSISTELPPNKPDVQRSGFAAWRTRDRGFSLFGKLLWDIDPYSYLALRIKSDGRKYFINIQTESIVPTDIHQHLLPCYTPGEWETVTIPFSAFVRTNYGMVVEPQREMLRQKVRSVGIGLTDRVPGPFELRIADIYATNKTIGKGTGKRDSGFEMEPEQPEDTGMMGEMEPARKKGEPERILI
ncbi:Complex I intermediate-associated protein 30 (CIA30) [Teratosphaeria destructans]|uniref:Complex I intermediate-associated protein 30 (CIA30) n=1 Tax=Teratosphaeria destructans TaxID=418781 RepID=A0A9W7W5H7_9PEZI|nr:Complex I intermediate-associated protein 30 (CIA30) [Teratosphaeria destructans]